LPLSAIDFNPVTRLVDILKDRHNPCDHAANVILQGEREREAKNFQVMSAELAARKRTGLDRRWTVCPCNGIDKVQAFMSLFGGNKF
jgi:hypothetical protein